MSTAPEKFLPEPERYELYSGAIHHFNLQRRDFFKVMGAGIAIFTVAVDAVAGPLAAAMPNSGSEWMGSGHRATAKRCSRSSAAGSTSSRESA